jgi:hypothetical protein
MPALRRWQDYPESYVLALNDVLKCDKKVYTGLNKAEAYSTRNHLNRFRNAIFRAHAAGEDVILEFLELARDISVKVTPAEDGTWTLTISKSFFTLLEEKSIREREAAAAGQEAQSETLSDLADTNTSGSA